MGTFLLFITGLKFFCEQYEVISHDVNLWSITQLKNRYMEIV